MERHQKMSFHGYFLLFFETFAKTVQRLAKQVASFWTSDSFLGMLY